MTAETAALPRPAGCRFCPDAATVTVAADGEGTRLCLPCAADEERHGQPITWDEDAPQERPPGPCRDTTDYYLCGCGAIVVDSEDGAHRQDCTEPADVEFQGICHAPGRETR